MEFTSDQIATILGSKELELIGLRMTVAQLQAQLKLLQPKESNASEQS